MKATLRIPTAQQYSYIEIETEGTLDEIVDQYNEANARVNGKSGQGISDKEFNAFIDNQMSGIPNTLETYNQMSPEQQMVVQKVKLSIKRLQARITREVKGVLAN